MRKNTVETILLKLLELNPKSREEFQIAKKRIAGALKIKAPRSSALLRYYHKSLKKSRIPRSQNFENWLKIREVRSISGVAMVTVLTKPFPCPGKCVYCPTEARMPKSYIASEPAAARALRHNFDPYSTTKSRIKLLESNGHAADKIELIIKGGTWSAYPEWYQAWFIGRCFDACNSLGSIDYLDSNVSGARIKTWIKPKLPAKEPAEITRKSIKKIWDDLKKAQELNEKKSKHRIIGLTIETRPDSISPNELLRLRDLGCTRVELGLQHTDDKILTLTKRGHTVAQFKNAAAMLRYAGFKVDFHTMPQQPGSTPKMDIKMYNDLYKDPDFRPDMIKIYPCVVVPSAELKIWHERGLYNPYSFQDLFTVLLKAKMLTPEYVRISRLIRDIPSTEIICGNTVTNLRETLQKELAKMEKRCKCLRCREYGRQIKLHPHLKDAKPKLFVKKFKSSNGTEYFFSFEDKDRLAVLGFLRLRINNTTKKDALLKPEEKTKIEKLLPDIKDAAIIRELHTYGTLVPIGENPESAAFAKAAQHKGIGRKLMAEAEKTAKQHSKSHHVKKIAVISGIGVREYYEKLGYKKENTYMVKKI